MSAALADADLSYARLRHADLSGAFLTSANLEGADLSRVRCFLAEGTEPPV